MMLLCAYINITSQYQANIKSNLLKKTVTLSKRDTVAHMTMYHATCVILF